MLELLRMIFNDYTFKVVALGTMILGLVSGVLSSFITLSKQSLIGDALSHSALPGIVLMFMLINRKDLELLLLGALLFGLLAYFYINIIRRYTKVKFDSALALVLSSFFGLGLVFLTLLQKQPDASQAGLETFIFGQASTMLLRDVYLMIIVSVIVLLLVVIFWKELKIFIFNPEYAQSLGFSLKKISFLFSTLIVLTVVIGLQAVGVILISSLLVAPGVAARQWSNKLSVMVILSGLFGAISGFIGTLISAAVPKVATGALIVVIVSSISLFSVLFGKERGVVWNKIKQNKNKHKVIYYTALKDIINYKELDENVIKRLINNNYLTIEDDQYLITDHGYSLISFYEGGLD